MTHKDYFEAILQLRSPTDEAIRFAQRELQGQISKSKGVRNGVDFYVRDKKRAENAGKKLRDEFGGEFSVTARLHSRDPQTGKELYRLSVLVKFPEFSKGDILVVNDVLIQVTGLGKRIGAKRLKDGKTIVLDYPEDYEILKKNQTRVVKVEPHVEVLHPETFQPVQLQNSPESNLVIEQKVDVVERNGLYIV